MKYFTREINGFNYKFATVNKNADGVFVDNEHIIYSDRKLGNRAIAAYHEELGTNVVLDIIPVKENRRMSVDFFMANSEVYVPKTGKADAE